MESVLTGSLAVSTSRDDNNCVFFDNKQFPDGRVECKLLRFTWLHMHAQLHNDGGGAWFLIACIQGNFF